MDLGREGGKGYKMFGPDGILLIGDGYFYIRKVIIVTVFP